MKKIRLKKLSLTNFKGIKSLEIDFDQSHTSIKGDNGTGKTTVFDAFTWLLFGKDHDNNTKFEIKTLDQNNKAIPKLNHEVEGLFEVDGKTITLKRTYSEKWTKQRGSFEAVLTSHVTKYFCDEVPKTPKEYSEAIKEIINEDLFKLLTNPFYFNSLSWSLRRGILEKIAQVLTDEELAKTNDKFSTLFEELSGKSLEDFKKIIYVKKKTVKEQLDEIPTRIDELTRNIPEDQDFQAIKDTIQKKEEDVQDIVSKIIDKSKVDQDQLNLISLAQKELSDLKFKSQEIRNDAKQKESSAVYENRKKQNHITADIDEVDQKIDRVESSLKSLDEKYKSDKSKVDGLRSEFDQEAAKTLPEDDTDYSCPTCKREFDEDVIIGKKAEMKTNFNTVKAEALEAINKRGKDLKNSLIQDEKEIESLKQKKEDLTKEKNALLEKSLKANAPAPTFDELIDTEEYKQSLKDISDAEVKLEDLRKQEGKVDQEVIDGLEEKKRILKAEISELSTDLYKEIQIKNGKERLQKLEDQGRIYAEELSELEGKEFMIEQFVSEKMNRIETAINNLFPSVRFNLFNHQINGGVTECCDTLINGVPFESANNAAKITAGVEIINVLANHYGINAPIFIDNAESIVKIPNTTSQMITLVVSENHDKLSINV